MCWTVFPTTAVPMIEIGRGVAREDGSILGTDDWFR